MAIGMTGSPDNVCKPRHSGRIRVSHWETAVLGQRRDQSCRLKDILHSKRKNMIKGNAAGEDKGSIWFSTLGKIV